MWPGVAPFGTMRFLMVISIANIGVAHAEYYTSEASLGAVSYYADGGEHSGVWVSGGGWSMTAGTPVTVDTLRAALSCVDPGTGERLGRRYTPGGTYRDPLGVERLRRSTSAFDLTFSVPKSISASWAVADTCHPTATPSRIRRVAGGGRRLRTGERGGVPERRQRRQADRRA